MTNHTSKAWKHENYLENILSLKPPEVLTKYSPLGFLGLDKYGGTVAVIPYGRIDASGLLLSAKIEDHERFIVQMMEKSKSLMIDERISQQTCIFDMVGFYFPKFTSLPSCFGARTVGYLTRQCTLNCCVSSTLSTLRCSRLHLDCSSHSFPRRPR